MKKSELFERAYRSEKSRGYFCAAENGTVLWANETARNALPLLIEGQPVSSVCPAFDMAGADEMLPLTGGRRVRLTRFAEEESDEYFYIAEFDPDFVDQPAENEMPGYAAMLAAQMRDKISRIRSLLSGSRDGLSDLQADYSGTVPHLAGKLDHQISWINGAEKDCDALIRHVMQFEENCIWSDSDRKNGRVDLGRYLPLLFRDVELALKEMDIPLELHCDWNAVNSDCWAGCSKEHLTMALLGLVRTAAVTAAQQGGGTLFVQGRTSAENFALRLRDSGTDPGQMEAYEPFGTPSGRMPAPAHLAADHVKRLLDAMDGRWMLGRTPGETGYTMQMLFPVLCETAFRLESAVSYRLEGLDYGMDGRWPAELSGQMTTIRVMLSALEDDMR